jgi:hypothetical protein
MVLISLEQYWRTAEYIDRILHDERPADFAGAGADEIRTGDQSHTLLARADEVID